MKIPYFPGCTLKTTAKNLEIPALRSAEALGMELVELPRWNCCGVVSSLTSDNLMNHLASVRNFIRVQEMNKEHLVEDENRLVTLCSMCYNTLTLTNIRVKNNPEDMESLNTFMHEEKEDYDGKVDVIHYLQLLDEMGFEEIKKRIKNPLKKLKIASYYGCMLLRPKDAGIDDPENPTILENLVETLGADPVTWDDAKRCCGSYHTVNNIDIVLNLAEGIINNARSSGADVIITSCPLCAFNLDSRQEEIVKRKSDFKTMPVLYFSQLLGLALDIEKNDLRLEDNFIDPLPVLRKLDLIKG
jgi:heterodisulfide reductase subunit B2